MRLPIRLELGVSLLVCAFLGCGPADRELTGKLAVVFLSENRTPSIGSEGEFWFRPVAPGERIEGTLLIRNEGTGPLTLEGFGWIDGAPTRIAGGSTISPVFEVSALPQRGLAPGAQLPVSVAFSPTARGDWASEIELRARDGSGEQRASIRLRGATPKILVPGPDIFVSGGPQLDIGPLVTFADREVVHRRRLAVFNIGTEPLQIAEISARPLDPSTSEDELELALPAGVIIPGELDHRAGRNLLVVELRFTPGALGSKRWELQVESSDPDEPSLVLTITAQVLASQPCEFSVSPAGVNFGLLSPPDYRDVLVTVENLGGEPVSACLISDLRVASDDGLTLSLPQGPSGDHVLEPGSRLEIVVRVQVSSPTPSGFQDLEGSLEFDVSSPTRPHVSVPFSAAFSPQCLTIVPGELDFGTVAVGCTSANRSVSVYNTCSSEVLLTGVSIVGPAGGGSSAFELVQRSHIPSGGLRIQPGETPPSYTVRYAPTDVGFDTGALKFELGTTGQEYVVPLHGTGAPASLQTDVFVRESMPKTDVLFVIDNSGAMSPHQQAVAANLNSMLQYFMSSYIDFRFAVTTADPAEGGALRTGATHPEPFLTRSSPNLEVKFAEKVNVGVSGGATQSCLDQALTALTLPQNVGFLRNDATLSVFCISASPDSSTRPVADHVADFRALKSGALASHFNFNAVGGFSAACPGDTGTLADVVAQTSGVSADICDANWISGFLPLVHHPFPFRTLFFLTAAADLSRGPIGVAIDAQPVPPHTASGDPVWHYDAVQNAIRFEEYSTFPPGSTMTVSYFTRCY